MKKVDDSFKDQISDLITAKDLRISEFALEKDFIVTDVLRVITKIRHEKFDLVFCGGTCLSKAYGLLERISEDVDIKVVPKSGITMSNGQRRTAISNLKKQIVAALVNVGFSEEKIQVDASDGNSYVVFNAEYSTHFDYEPEMRAQLKLELNTSNLSHPSVEREIGLLFNQLAEIKEPDKLKMRCVNIQEALAEKLISFPRRLAMHLSDTKRFEFDNALVRHLFDVHRIIESSPELSKADDLKPLLKKVMDKDALDFARQYPKFLADPVGEIINAMNVARSNQDYRTMYEKFVAVMVYGDNSPSFDAAMTCFSNALTPALPAANINFLRYSTDLAPSR